MRHNILCQQKRVKFSIEIDIDYSINYQLKNGFPTGVEVCHSMNHGGPIPATTDSRTTSVGTAAIKRFLRPVCYQNFPKEALPKALKNGNNAKIWRLVDGHLGQASV